MHVIGVKEERGKVEEILEKAIDDNFPKLSRGTVLKLFSALMPTESLRGS